MAHIFLRSKGKSPKEKTGQKKKDKEKSGAHPAPLTSRLSDRDESPRTRRLSHPKIPTKKIVDELYETQTKTRRIERDERPKTVRLHPKLSSFGDGKTATGPTQTGRFRRPDSGKFDPKGGQKLFKFRAIKYVGKEKNEVTGIMVGEDEKDVTRRLQQTDHIIVSVRPKRGFDFGSKMFGPRAGGAGGGGRVPLNELLMFTQQLATMVEAGNPLLSSLEVLRDQSRNPALSAALGDVSEEIRKGASLSESLARHPKIFDELYVNLVKAGETSGRLALNLTDLAVTLEEAATLRGEIVSAMTYPVISLVVIFGVSAAILLGVIPKFKEIFEGMKLELPLLTKIVLGLSDLLRHHIIMVLAGALAVTVGLHLYRKTESGKYNFDWLKLQLPVFGPLFVKVVTARVCNTFALMLRSGVSTLIALELAGEAAGNRVYSDEVVRIKDRVKDGWSLSEAFSEGGVFSFMVGHMLSVGEESGNVDLLLEKLSGFFKDQVRSTIKRLTAAIEPIMIVTMGLVVGTMVLAIFLPIIELQKSLRGG